MPNIPDEILYDVRLIRRHVDKGLITWEQVEKRRQQADDMTEQAEIMDLDAMQAGAQGAQRRPGNA